MDGALSYALTLNTSAFSAGISSASGMLRGFAGAAGSAAAAVAKIAAPLAALGGGVGIFAALNKAANFESLSVSMRVLVGDAQEAARVMQELKSFSNATPFEFADIAEAGKILIALGGSSKTVTAELSMLGDIAAGVNVPLKELVTTYGKARSDGVLYADTLNQFAEKGIGIYDLLAQKLSVSTGEVKKMASEGQIGFGLLEEVLGKLTASGGKFFGMMQEQAGTTKGLLSTLKSAMDDLLVAIGTPINDMLKPMLAANIQRVQELGIRFRAFLELLDAAGKQGNLGELIGVSLKVGIIEGINTLSSGIRGTMAYLGTALPVIMSAAVDVLTSDRTVIFFRSLFSGLGNLIRSQMESAIASLARTMGLHLKWRDMNRASAQSGQRADLYFQTAGAALGTGDMGEGIQKLTNALEQANEAGKLAAAAASAKPLIDPALARSQFKEVAGSLNKAALDRLINPVIESTAKLAPAVKSAVAAVTKASVPPAKPAAASAGYSGGGSLMDTAEAAAATAGRPDRLSLRLMAARIRRGGSWERGLAGSAAELARGGAAADPRRGGSEGAATTPQDRLTKLVQGIYDQFSNLATA